VPPAASKSKLTLERQPFVKFTVLLAVTNEAVSEC
jgi:hypothetical protein